MVQVANAELLITVKGSSIDIAVTGVDKFYLDEPGTNPVFKSIAEINTAVTATEPVNEHFEDIAFVCFTSGSTGTPKGIPISDSSLAAFLPVGQKKFLLSDNSVTIQNSALAFDASIAEVMLTLAAGGKIKIPTTGRPLLGRKLKEFITRNNVKHLFATPSVLTTRPDKIA